MCKVTFIVYADRIDYTDEMTLEEQGLFYRTIFRYYNGLDVGDIGQMKFLWSKIKKQIDSNNIKREQEREKRSKAGIEGNKKRRGDSKPSQNIALAIDATENIAKIADTVTVYVNDTVYDNKVGYGETKRVLLTEREFERLKSDYGSRNTHEYIERLENYIINKLKGKDPYAEHNLTIRSRMNKDKLKKSEFKPL